MWTLDHSSKHQLRRLNKPLTLTFTWLALAVWLLATWHLFRSLFRSWLNWVESKFLLSTPLAILTMNSNNDFIKGYHCGCWRCNSTPGLWWAIQGWSVSNLRTWNQATSVRYSGAFEVFFFMNFLFICFYSSNPQNVDHILKSPADHAMLYITERRVREIRQK